MSITTLPKGVRAHPSGTGYQVRISPFPARTFDEATEATDYAHELRRRKRHGILTPPADPTLAYTTLGEATAEHLHRLETVGGARRRRYSPAGLAKARQAARPWRYGPFASTPLAALDPRKVRRYLEDRSAAHPRAAAGEWQALRGALVLAQLDGEEFNPSLLQLGVARRTPDKRRPLTLEEVDYLAEFAPEHMRRLFPLAATLGMRIGELLAAEDSWLDLKAKTLTIPARATKERRERRIKLMAREVRLFREQLVARGAPSPLLFPRLHGTAWTHSHFWQKVLAPTRRRAAAEWRIEHGLAADARTPFEWPLLDERGEPVLNARGKPRVGGVAPHDFRRGAATDLIELGLAPDLAAHRLGHKDAGYLLVQRYASVRDERLDAAIANLDAAGALA